jgi:phenylalanyl-tRNA synthetase beta chain
MIERGQPLHAFDLAKIKGGKILVRPAAEKETIVTIDGVERVLDGSVLVIADEEKPVAIAGIMGGKESEVTENTREIVLESAYFYPPAVRRASKKLNLASESSYRFERDVDFTGVMAASTRAAALIGRLGRVNICKGPIDLKTRYVREKTLLFSLKRMNALLDTKIHARTAIRYLKRLHCRVNPAGVHSLRVAAPSYRVDIKREIDLIEEIARMYGYDKIHAVPPRAVCAVASGEQRVLGRHAVATALCSLGFSEAICLSFMGETEMDALLWPPQSEWRRAVRLVNPVSEEFAYLRSTLLPSLLRVLTLNVNRGVAGVRLFELGTVFSRSEKEDAAPIENERIGLIATGPIGDKTWCSSPATVDFSYLKGVLEALTDGLDGRFQVKPAVLPGFHPGRTALLTISGTDAGYIGELHPQVTASKGIKGRVVFAEVDLGALIPLILGEKKFKAIPRFPAVDRDVALVVPEGIAAQEIVNTVEGAVPELIRKVRIFDLYRGEPIPDGSKGLAIAVRLQSDKGTLTEPRIAAAMENIKSALVSVGCTIR